MSKHYIQWAQKNAKLNNLNPYTNKYITDNCLTWLDKNTEKYDLIFLDPPTFSNSKKMENTFDVQRDHVPLIKKVMNHLAPQGTLIFSNNNQKFKLNKTQLTNYKIENWTNETIPPDYKRKSNIHNCWKIKK